MNLYRLNYSYRLLPCSHPDGASGVPSIHFAEASPELYRYSQANFITDRTVATSPCTKPVAAAHTCTAVRNSNLIQVNSLKFGNALSLKLSRKTLSKRDSLLKRFFAPFVEFMGHKPRYEREVRAQTRLLAIIAPHRYKLLSHMDLLSARLTL